MMDKEGGNGNRNTTTIGGSGAVNVFGGQLTINHLSLSTETKALRENKSDEKLGYLKDIFKTNYSFRCQSNISGTRKTHEALEYLLTSYSVLIYGGAGEGKTACAYQLSKELINNGLISLHRCAFICEPFDIKNINPDNVDLIFIDNIFGTHNADQSKLQLWRNYFETLDSLALSKKVRIIIASRMHIYLVYRHELNKYHVFANKVHLDSTEMTIDEKRGILECQVQSCERHMEKEEIEKCISQHSAVVGFPLCCQLFASNKSLPRLSAELFKPSFVSFLDTSLRVLDALSLTSLIYVFTARNSFKHMDMNIVTMSNQSKETLCKLAKLYGIVMPLDSLVKEMRSNVESLNGSYLKEIDGNITFIHDTVYEAVARIMSVDCPTVLIEKCTVEFLCQCIRLDRAEYDTDIVIKAGEYHSLARRCIYEVVSRCNTEQIAKHPAFRNDTFVKTLMNQLVENDEFLRDFFSSGVTLKSQGIHGFLYHVLSQVDANSAFFDTAYDHLPCRHSCAYDDSCWKCQVKEEALAAACGSNNQELYERLIDEDVRITSFCLFKAVENPNVHPEFVSTIIADLKNCNRFILDEGYLQMAFGLSMRHNEDKIFKILKENGLKFTVHFLYFAVQKGDSDLLSSVVQELVETKRWKADNYYVSRAILEARIENTETILQCLTDYGAEINEGAVYWAVVDHGHDEVVSIVHTLKKSNTFDGESHHLAWALAVSMKERNSEICKFLRSEGVIATPTLVSALAELGESTEKIHEIVKELQREDRWNVQNRFIAGAYMHARRRANKGLYDMFVAEGVGLCPGCFYHAVIWYVGEVECIMEVLKSDGCFDPENTNLTRALVWATEYRDADYVSWLENAGLCFNMACLIPAVERSFSLSTLENVITNIKAGAKWDPSCDHALVALNRACNREDKTAYELLLSEGIKFVSKSVLLATKHETLYGFKKVFHELRQKHLLDTSSLDFKNAILIAKSFKDRNKYREIKRLCRENKIISQTPKT